MFRPFFIGKTTKAYLVFISGLCTAQDVDLQVLMPLMHVTESDFPDLGRMAEQVPIWRDLSTTLLSKK
ncbi:hypothetical protein [Brevibacillus agri]|uniref:hypothetical protein n=1 Tax=Brevibacillus agri TaxID=51101 RepID=UPI002E1E6499